MCLRNVSELRNLFPRLQRKGICCFCPLKAESARLSIRFRLDISYPYQVFRLSCKILIAKKIWGKFGWSSPQKSLNSFYFKCNIQLDEGVRRKTVNSHPEGTKLQLHSIYAFVREMRTLSDITWKTVRRDMLVNTWNLV